MKTLIIITTLLAVCSFKASDTKEIISRIPKTSIPFECTRTTPGARPITAIYPTGRELPQYIYDDITLSHKTSFKNYNSIFKRFEWPKTTFEVLAIRIGVSDPELGVLATLTQDGELIDYIEAEMLFYRDKPLYIMQYRIDKDATIIVTRLNVISDKPVMFYEELKEKTNLFIKIFCYNKNAVYLCSIERTFFETHSFLFTLKFPYSPTPFI